MRQRLLILYWQLRSRTDRTTLRLRLDTFMWGAHCSRQNSLDPAGWNWLCPVRTAGTAPFYDVHLVLAAALQVTRIYFPFCSSAVPRRPGNAVRVPSYEAVGNVCKPVDPSSSVGHLREIEIDIMRSMSTQSIHLSYVGVRLSESRVHLAAEDPGGSLVRGG